MVLMFYKKKFFELMSLKIYSQNYKKKKVHKNHDIIVNIER